MAQQATAWAVAKAEILADVTLSTDERNMLRTSTISDVIGEISSLDKEHAIHSTSRKVMQTLDPVLKGLEKYGSALDVLAQADPNGILTLVWGSMRVLLAVAKGFTKYFDELTKFLGDIARPLSRLQDYGHLIPESTGLQNALRNVFVEFIKFIMKTRRMFVDKTNKSNTRKFHGSCICN
jgi:hypothetical protein